MILYVALASQIKSIVVYFKTTVVLPFFVCAPPPIPHQIGKFYTRPSSLSTFLKWWISTIDQPNSIPLPSDNCKCK